MAYDIKAQSGKMRWYVSVHRGMSEDLSQSKERRGGFNTTRRTMKKHEETQVNLIEHVKSRNFGFFGRVKDEKKKFGANESRVQEK